MPPTPRAREVPDPGALSGPPGSPPAVDGPSRRALAASPHERRGRGAGPRFTLLTGPAGTDRLHVAERLHGAGGRRGPCVLVRCAFETGPLAGRRFLGTGARGDAVGYLELARRGTLVLDDVSTLPTDLQSLVVVAIETGRLPGGAAGGSVACDLVCVLREPIAQASRAGRLHPDLRYALAGNEIRVPPLASTRPELDAVVGSMLATLDRRTGRRSTVAPALMAAIAAAHWPGNHVQLRAVLAALHAAASGAELALDDVARRHLPPPRDARPRIEVGETLASTRRRWLEATLRAVGGHRARAARLLGVSPRTLYSLRRQAQVAPPSPDARACAPEPAVCA